MQKAYDQQTVQICALFHDELHIIAIKVKKHYSVSSSTVPLLFSFCYSRPMLVNFFTGATLLLFSLGLAHAKRINYSVIVEVPDTNAAHVAVVVDNKTFRLKQSDYGIMFTGKADAALSSYHYAIVDGCGNTIVSEAFERPPYIDPENVEPSTFNEFFNRSNNRYTTKQLPIVLDYPTNIHKLNSELHKLDEIPTIHIYGNTTATELLHAKENQLKDVEVKLKMTYISLKETRTFDNVIVSLAGSSSRYVPKLSYKLKLSRRTGDNLFGYTRLKLRASGYDPSYLREKISIDSLRSAGVPASGYSYVRVFVDNKAVGLFGLVDAYQKPWVANTFAGGNSKYKPGYLYQAKGFIQETPNSFLTSDLVYLNNLTKFTEGQYDIDDGPSKKNVKDYKDLQSFTKFIGEASIETTSLDRWEQRLDVDGFLRAMVLENLLGFSDSFMTVGHNYYLYQDPQENGRFTYIPNDMDTSIGLTDYPLEMIINGNYTEYPGIFLRPLTKVLLSYPTYQRRFEELLLLMADDLVNPNIMFPYIDDTIDMIRPDVEWDQTLERKGQLLRVNVLQNVQNMSAFIEFFHRNQPGAAVIFDNLTDLIPNATFDQAINGPSPHTRSECVKPFLSKKYDAIKKYYNNKQQQSNTQPFDFHKFFEAARKGHPITVMTKL